MDEQNENVALDNLYNALRNPAFRREFVRDHRQTMIDAGIEPGDIDEGFLSTLSELSPAELRVVVDVIGRLRVTVSVRIPF